MATKPWERKYVSAQAVQGQNDSIQLAPQAPIQSNGVNPWQRQYNNDSVIGGSNSMPEMQSTVDMSQRTPTELAQMKMFGEQPQLDQFMGGVGKTLHSTFVAPAQLGYEYLTGGKQGFEQKQQQLQNDLQAYNTASQGGSGMSNLGEVGMDIGLTVIPAMKIAKGVEALKLGNLARAGLTGAGQGLEQGIQHQIQNVGSGQSINPAELGIETAVSTALPMVGNYAQKVFKNRVPEQMYEAVKPKGALTKGINPVDFQYAIDRGVVPRFGGLQKSLKRTETEISKVANQRDHILKNADIRINIPQAMQTAQQKIIDMVNRSEISVADAEKAFDTEREVLRNAYIHNKKAMIPHKQFGVSFSVSGENALDLRKLADKGTKWNKLIEGNEPPARSIYMLAYRDALNDQMDSRIANGIGRGTVGAKVGKKSIELRKDLSKLIPYKQALKNRLETQRSNFGMGLLDYTALMAGAGLGAGGGQYSGDNAGMGAGLGALALLGGRKFTSTIGGARMMNDIAKFGTSNVGTNLLQQSMGAGRSINNNLNKDNQ